MRLLCECLHRNVHTCAVQMCAVLLICVTHFYKVGGYAARVEQIGTEETVPISPYLEECSTLTVTTPLPARPAPACGMRTFNGEGGKKRKREVFPRRLHFQASPTRRFFVVLPVAFATSSTCAFSRPMPTESVPSARSSCVMSCLRKPGFHVNRYFWQKTLKTLSDLSNALWNSRVRCSCRRPHPQHNTARGVRALCAETPESRRACGPPD